jgi:Flp pilus assembly protein TadG
MTDSRRARSDRGMTTSQVAIVFPALLFFIMLIVQYGLWFHAKQVADNAAAEALDAAQTPTGTADDGHRAALSFLSSSGNLDDIVIEVERDLEQVQVQITGAAPQLVPGFSWNVTSAARAPVERFIPEPDR